MKMAMSLEDHPLLLNGESPKLYLVESEWPLLEWVGFLRNFTSIFTSVKFIFFFFSVIPPVVMNYLDRKGFLKRFPWAAAPIQIGMCKFTYYLLFSSLLYIQL